MRTKFAALLGAGGLLLLAASGAIAAPKEYSISVSKTATPATVPASGADVEFTITVTNDGTGFLQQVNVSDPLAGCTLSDGEEVTGNDDSKFEAGEVWEYTCTVEDVMPGTENTATVNACHSEGPCTEGDASDVASVTVTLTPPTISQSPTDTATEVASGSGWNGTVMLVLALGMLVASIVVLNPKRAIRARDSQR